MGLLLYGDLFGKLVNYNLAVMNGQGINLKDKNNQKDIVGSLMVHPLDWLSVGGSFVKGKGCAVAVSSLNPDIQVGENYTVTGGRQVQSLKPNRWMCARNTWPEKTDTSKVTVIM